MIIQPTQRGQMRVRKRCCDPYDNIGIQSGKICHYLAKMLMIRLFQLVLNKNFAIIDWICSKNIRVELMN